MKIILDGMGGDNAPQAIVEGAVRACKSIKDEIVIVGRQEEISSCLDQLGYQGDQITIRHAEDVITNEDAPVKAVRRKKESSMVVGMNMVKNGEGDIFISAGSTGALLAGGMLIIGRVKGIDRPTLATVYPMIGGEPCFLTDTGANSECRPRNLLEFATMGSIYMEKVIGRENPTVGLVNNGTEETKGTALTKQAHALLAKSNLNFIGNVEARELQNHACDVIVTDGFTGNVILKLTEGIGLMVLRELKRRFLATGKSKLGALLLKDQLVELKKDLDYTEYGGAPILGVMAPLVKMHGSSDANACEKTILKAIPYVEGNVVGLIEDAISGLEEVEKAIIGEEEDE